MSIKKLTDFAPFFGHVIAVAAGVWNFLMRHMLNLKRVWRIGILATWLGLIAMQPSWGFGTSATPAVQLLVGYPPGGLADRLSRLAAAHLSQELKRQIIVKNLSGANGIRAVLEVQQSRDGSEILLFADSSLIVAQQATSNNAPDLKVFGPVGTMGFTPFAIAVPAASPFKTLPELLSFLRQNPSVANYGTPGVHSIHQLSAEMLLKWAGSKAQHIPYQGGLAMLGDLLQQRLTFGVLSVQLAQQYVRQQQMRVLAVTGAKRSPQMPDVPTLSETYPGLSAVSTAYLMAAPGMEPTLYKAIVTSWRRLMTSSDFLRKLEDADMEGGMNNNEHASWLIRQETKHWGQLLQPVGVD